MELAAARPLITALNSIRQITGGGKADQHVLAMMARKNLHLQRQYTSEDHRGCGEGLGLQPSGPTCVASQVLLVGLCMKQDAGLNRPLL